MSARLRVRFLPSGSAVRVPAGTWLTSAATLAGVAIVHDCDGQGVCGTCETRVLDGVPDHRDVILTPEERAEGRTMMICVSGARTSRLVLDL